MFDRDEYERNNAAYRRLKETIKQTYPHGWWVAIADEQVIGAAATVSELRTALLAQGRDPQRTLAVEAGVDYPEYVTIFIC